MSCLSEEGERARADDSGAAAAHRQSQGDSPGSGAQPKSEYHCFLCAVLGVLTGQVTSCRHRSVILALEWVPVSAEECTGK